MGKKHVDLNNKTILVTGSPGFIGANLVLRLLREMTGGTVVSLDNMNDYYDPKLKEYRLSLIEQAAASSPVKHVFIRGSIADKALVNRVFAEYKPAVVVNLAAQAGVRYSIDHPDVYIESNLIGFYNILEACRHSYDGGETGVEHLVYASSSSVYGGNKKVPFSVEDKVDNPVSLYAATKKSNELLAHSYAKLYNIPSTGLRFFTVYGPAGRPDMFYYSATQKLVKGETISIFNYGNCKRDFTYVDDIVEGVLRVMGGAPEKAVGEDGLPLPPYAVYNIGGGTPENLLATLRRIKSWYPCSPATCLLPTPTAPPWKRTTASAPPSVSARDCGNSRNGTSNTTYNGDWINKTGVAPLRGTTPVFVRTRRSARGARRRSCPARGWGSRPR